MTILDFDDYKLYLRHVVNNKKRGIISRLAEAAGCQRSYLSQALSTHVHLTSDHLYGIGLFLQLNNDEIDLLLLLLEKEKASSQPYQLKVKEKIEKVKTRALRLSKKVGTKQSQKISNKYYSVWYYAALHVATSMEKLKSDIDFSHYLNLPQGLIQSCLRELEQWGLVKYKGDSWVYVGESSVHLPDSSFLNRINHINWRNWLLSQPLRPTENVHYTSVFTTSKEDVMNLRRELLSFISKQRQKIAKSGSEELISFCCDYSIFSP